MENTSKVPRHVAIIMDGNGRWAEKQGYPRAKGHEVGVQRVEEAMRYAGQAGVKYLTLYAFSKENWQRPKQEVGFLMALLSNHLDRNRQDLMKNNIAFKAIGRLQDMPQEIQQKIARNEAETARNTGLTCTVAFSYSSRLEMVEACRELARKAARGEVKPEEISENDFSHHLYTKDLPDPDLLVRTSGEMRISNFLLWQISYAELYITDKCWPEFNEEEFGKALQVYAQRERRFGKTGQAVSWS